MPIIKSAVKRVRQTKSRTSRNAVVKRRLKDALKELDSALASRGRKDLAALLSNLQSKLDTAVKKNLLHQNKADRLKRRYAAAVKAAGPAKRKTSAKSSKSPSKKPTAQDSKTAKSSSS